MISDPSQWQLLFLQNFSGEYFGVSQMPIPKFDTPIFSNSLVRVKITSSNALATWVRAGRVSQVVDAGGVGSVFATHFMTLDEYKIIDCSKFASYSLRVSLPKYFKQATISIFGYAGAL
ncbi:hypothetical protein [Pseudanabaena sp. 'Roaring Creek']|uniref:hypothetical protein n=1 Tax=Pseudanabaena sp. 'Roaring Creek' TaxID=1681830 RepID=UPI0006D776DA|nr:hypothetical protein [Pseudanabaena sp. 'Roaring Creek']